MTSVRLLSWVSWRFESSRGYLGERGRPRLRLEPPGVPQAELREAEAWLSPGSWFNAAGTASEQGGGWPRLPGGRGQRLGNPPPAVPGALANRIPLGGAKRNRSMTIIVAGIH